MGPNSGMRGLVTQIRENSMSSGILSTGAYVHAQMLLVTSYSVWTIVTYVPRGMILMIKL